MKIKRGDIQLKKLVPADIELVRNWRNSKEVNQHMEYREHITEEMQKDWFRKVDNDNNLYFLIVNNCRAIGLIYGADIDWAEKRVGNAGIFIAEESDREAAFALEASILLNDYAFSIGIEIIFIKVLRDNQRAITYNKLFGYKLLPGQEDEYNQKYVLSKEAYISSRKKLEPYLRNGGAFEIII